MPSESTGSDKVAVSVSDAIAEQYNALVTGVQLLNVRLAKAEAFAPNIYVSDSDRKLEARISTSAAFIDIPAGFVAQAGLRFEGYYPDEEAPHVSVSMELELVYSASVPMTEDLFEQFQQRNLPLNAWPYFRETLQSSLARLGWPVYTLPAFHTQGRDTQTAATAPAESVDSANSDNDTKEMVSKGGKALDSRGRA